MADRRPVMDAPKRKHVKALERRRNYLTKAIDEPNSDASRAWDRGELAALEFALRTIRNHYQERKADAEQPAN